MLHMYGKYPIINIVVANGILFDKSKVAKNKSTPYTIYDDIIITYRSRKFLSVKGDVAESMLRKFVDDIGFLF